MSSVEAVDTYFGRYGGSFLPEVLHECQQDLIRAYRSAKDDPEFQAELMREWQQFSGRPTPLTFCSNLSQHFGGAQLYLKREDLNHSGAHKMNNVLGQGLLVQRMGKKRVIAETGAGQHGVATALVAARLGLQCTVYMGAKDIARQYPNVFWMKQLGAEVIPVTSGSQTLKDALDAALKDWSSTYNDSHYLIGTACGCAPFPEMVADFQSVIGREAMQQSLALWERLPDSLYAAVGGGSNACGLFLPFLEQADVALVGVEAGGKSGAMGEHAIRLSENKGSFGIAQGFSSVFLQDEHGQLQATHSIAAGLDYVGVSPIIADLADKQRLRMTSANDTEVIEAFQCLLRMEGIIPALESAHALAGAIKDITQMSPQERVVVCLSGRGDKDIFNIAKAVQDPEFPPFLAEYASTYHQAL